MKVTINTSKSGINDAEFKAFSPQIKAIHAKIHTQNAGIENAWVELPNNIDAEIKRIKDHAKWVRDNSDVLLCIGIGGSYLGAYAGLEMFPYDVNFPVVFLGTSLDAQKLVYTLKKYADKRVALNIISKSGTTTEILETFKIVDEFMRKKYPSKEEYSRRVIATTDVAKGVLRDFAAKNNLVSFPLPNGVGGRFSALCAVGLFPFAVAGLDIDAMLKGAKAAYKDCNTEKSEAYKYAIARNILNTKRGKSVEVFVGMYETLSGLGAWCQQLFGESEGKRAAPAGGKEDTVGRGLFPCHMIFTRDLHSMGQFIQQGTPLLFETFIDFEKPPVDLPTINKLNRAAYLGTVKAHSDAGVPILTITASNHNQEAFGYLLYFFEIACAASAYLLDVNPFDQPGVEAYKKEMKEFMK